MKCLKSIKTIYVWKVFDKTSILKKDLNKIGQ